MKLRKVQSYVDSPEWDQIRVTELKRLKRVLRAANLLLTDPAPQRLQDLREAVAKFEVR